MPRRKPTICAVFVAWMEWKGFLFVTQTNLSNQMKLVIIRNGGQWTFGKIQNKEFVLFLRVALSVCQEGFYDFYYDAKLFTWFSLAITQTDQPFANFESQSNSVYLHRSNLIAKHTDRMIHIMHFVFIVFFVSLALGVSVPCAHFTDGIFDWTTRLVYMHIFIVCVIRCTKTIAWLRIFWVTKKAIFN